MSVVIKHTDVQVIFDEDKDVKACVRPPRHHELGEWKFDAFISMPPQALLDQVMELWANTTKVLVTFPHDGRTRRGHAYLISATLIGPRVIQNDVDPGVDLVMSFVGTGKLEEI